MVQTALFFRRRLILDAQMGQVLNLVSLKICVINKCCLLSWLTYMCVVFFAKVTVVYILQPHIVQAGNGIVTNIMFTFTVQLATWCRQVGRAELRYANLREG